MVHDCTTLVDYALTNSAASLQKLLLGVERFGISFLHYFLHFRFFFCRKLDWYQQNTKTHKFCRKYAENRTISADTQNKRRPTSCTKKKEKVMIFKLCCIQGISTCGSTFSILSAKQLSFCILLKLGLHADTKLVSCI